MIPLPIIIGLQKNARALAQTRKVLNRIEAERKAIAEQFEQRYVSKPKRRIK